LIHAEIDRDIRKRADYNRQTERMGDSYRRAALDREILLKELDDIRAIAWRCAAVRHKTKGIAEVEQLLAAILGVHPDDIVTAAAPEHHPV
jgi:hypothetical protein